MRFRLSLETKLDVADTEVRRAWFSAQVNVKSDFMSIFLLTFIRRTSTLKQSLRKELRPI
jgi:hypothetical protein